MFELGTHKSKLYRSSKNEWIGGTEGFYWGCNNTKDLEVRKETAPSLAGKPANMVFRPHDRDVIWQRLFQEHKGKIDATFGFKAFTTPHLAAFRSCDAKFTTTALARELKSWALFGPPLGRTWDATPEEMRRLSDIKPLAKKGLGVDGSPPPPPARAPRPGGPAGGRPHPQREEPPGPKRTRNGPEAGCVGGLAWHLIAGK